jgi:hypothetical protein
MKANLGRFLFFLFSLSFLLGFVTRPATAGAPAGQTSAPTQARPSAPSNIEIETWNRPEPGWLYVLDPKADAGGPGGRVWLIDPETETVMGSIRTGNSPDFALSPDGSRLYVASVMDTDSSELAVIDTAQGVVLKSGMVVGRAVTDGLPPFSTMAVSGDGLALRILIDDPKSSGADSLLLATFDAQAGEFLPGIVHLGNCGPGRFISYPTADHFDFLCPRTNRVRMIRVDADSRELQNVDVTLPWERRNGVAEAIEVPGSQEIAIVRGDGAVVKMDPGSQGFADTPAHPGLPNRIPPAAWPTSPDGSRVYLGYNGDYDRRSDNRFYLDYGRPPNVRPNSAMAYEFRVIDTRTWQKIGTIKTKMPFWSAATGNEGKILYAMAPQKHSILVIDTVKMRQSRILKVGGTPTLALVAP